MKYFENVNDLKALKDQYRKLAKALHPDLGGNAADFIAMNKEYEQLLDTLEANGAETYNRKQTVTEEGNAFRETIITLLKLNLIVEVCGDWLWISGDTKPVKEELKAIGCRWSRNKSRWYWAPAYSKTHSRGNTTMEHIRATYGSKWFQPPKEANIQTA